MLSLQIFLHHVLLDPIIGARVHQDQPKGPQMQVVEMHKDVLGLVALSNQCQHLRIAFAEMIILTIRTREHVEVLHGWQEFLLKLLKSHRVGRIQSWLAWAFRNKRNKLR